MFGVNLKGENKFPFTLYPKELACAVGICPALLRAWEQPSLGLKGVS